MSLVAYHEKGDSCKKENQNNEKQGFKKDRTPLEGGVRSVQFAI